jgi:hypothetical protein
MDHKAKLIEMLYADRFLAHRYLFEHRHKNTTPEFHNRILKAFYSPRSKVVAKCFRGSAKSTLAEEYVILGSLFRDFRYPLLIGNSYDSACERMSAIKHELETNELIMELFGPQVGPVWTESEIVLMNGARIKAYGARQSLRGSKTAEGDRPDLALVDDLEDEENVQTPEARYKIKRWVTGSLYPALVPITGKIRVLGTPLHPKSYVEECVNSDSFESIVVPVCYIADTGEDVASWPDRFPLSHIEELRETYRSGGSITEFEQEYMCRAEDAASKPFKAGMFRIAAIPSGFNAVEVMVDPARTVNARTSARTGYTVWSWIGRTLYVLEAFGAFHKPDEIIDTICKLNEKYNPAKVGVEADGLEEFIMQPLRAEQVKRGVSIPLYPQRAPRDKNSFISSLQPFYTAGDVVHVKSLPDLEGELLSFPTGRVDVPNALAYAIRMRAGKPIYEDFTSENVFNDLEIDGKTPRYLCVSATPAMTAAALLQFKDGSIKIFKDWVRNEPPKEAMPIIIQEAVLECGDFSVVVPPEQMDKYVNFGLPAALRPLQNRVIRGQLAASSIGVLAPFIKTRNKGEPGLLVSKGATWVLNGLARGYARKMLKTGAHDDTPEENQYSLVMEAIESFAGFIQSGMLQGTDERVYATTADGRRFISTLPRKQ